MHHHGHGAVRYYTFESLPDNKLTHAVFSRHGGVSPIPYNTLNMSVSTGDTLQNVRENWRRAYKAVGLHLESMATLWQIHSAQTIVVHDSPCDPYTKGDGLVTDQPDVSLFLRFADCVPILLYDPVHRAIGIAHSGWQGTVKGVAQAAVQAMIANYGCRPENILAGMGPSIGPERYQVGADVVEAVHKAFRDPGELLVARNGQLYFDLWEANKRVLQGCGVREIEITRMCTATRRDEWFSHRGDGGHTGRFGAVIVLRP